MTALSNATCIKINHSKLTTDLAGGSWKSGFGGQRDEGIGPPQRAQVATCRRQGTGGEHGRGGDGGDAVTAGVLPSERYFGRGNALIGRTKRLPRGARAGRGRSAASRARGGEVWHRPQEMPGALPYPDNPVLDSGHDVSGRTAPAGAVSSLPAVRRPRDGCRTAPSLPRPVGGDGAGHPDPGSGAGRPAAGVGERLRHRGVQQPVAPSASITLGVKAACSSNALRLPRPSASPCSTQCRPSEEVAHQLGAQ